MKKRKRIFLDLARRYRDKSIIPPCGYFYDCGGCSFQDISYENQLLMKRDYLNIVFQDIHNFTGVRPSRPFEYRSRMDFVTAFKKMGLRKQGDYRQVVDIESCKISMGKANRLMAAIRPLLADIEDYDYLNHKGCLRYIVLRQAMFTDMVMVNFVVARESNRLKHIIDKIYDEADSISILFNDGLADLSFGRVIENVKKGTIEEDYGGTRLCIAPNSFLQSNSEMAVKMYEKIREQVNGRTLDLYSGVGSISLFAADRCEAVTGIELLSEAVDTAEINRELNGIENAGFICMDALDYLREENRSYDTVILDPPRAGMHPKVVKELKKMSPPKIIYMSCNPESFKRDLELLDGYALESIEAFDMFPQTPHIETLAVLIKR